MNKLAGKRVLVTAGGQGIGLAISEEMMECGAYVAVHYHTSRAAADELVANARGVGLKAFAVQADLTVKSDAERLVRTVDEQLGGLDVLINNAGSLIARTSLEDVDEDYWRKVIDVNVTSCLWVTQGPPYRFSRATQTAASSTFHHWPVGKAGTQDRWPTRRLKAQF